MRSLVVLPTYQEAENIEEVLERLRALPNPPDVLVVDDSSPDGTAGLARSVGARLGGIEVLVRPAKSGLGSAYRAGFRWGLEHGYEVLIEMDSDLSHSPEAIPALIAAVEQGGDLAVGSRYVPGGRIPDWSTGRRLLSEAGNRYASVALRIHVKDMTSGFRAYRASVLERIDLDLVKADGYGFQIEMVMLVSALGGRVCEVPITFVDRRRGSSKMSLAITTEALWLVTRWGLDRLRGKPLGAIRGVVRTEPGSLGDKV
jgi:dolichol-phosphate mannosyltransferase